MNENTIKTCPGCGQSILTDQYKQLLPHKSPAQQWCIMPDHFTMTVEQLDTLRFETLRLWDRLELRSEEKVVSIIARLQARYMRRKLAFANRLRKMYP